MPETGERAPERMLVAVRAMAPVAGIPPNRADAPFATPCATSSQFERCRRPVMPSATTAESRLSTPARNAIVKALGSSSAMRDIEISGITGAGKLVGMPPKREPIVSTGRPSIATPAAAATTAIRKAGSFGASLRIATMATSDSRATATVAGETVSRASQNACHFARKLPGTLSSDRPNRSRIWLEKMMTAMPAVKPVTTGSGMYLIQVPRRARPATTSIAEAMNVASTSPS